MEILKPNREQLLLVGASLFLLGFFWVGSPVKIMGQDESPKPKPGGVLRIKPFDQSLNTDLDPAGNSSPLVTEHLYEGLVRFDQNLGIVPGLAEYWSISKDGKKMTFYLRKEARFHNGQEVTAEDVKFSLERLFQTKKKPAFYLFASRIEGGEEFWEGISDEVTGIKVIDKRVLEINWNQGSISNIYFLTASFAKILPKNLVLKQKRFFDKPIGAGPFKFDYWLRNSRLDIIGIRLVRNEDYFTRKPFLEAVEISPYFTLDDFFQNEVEIIPYLSYRISRDKYPLLESNLLRMTYLFFSCHLPPFDRPEVRRAIQSFLEKRPLAGLSSTTARFCQVTNSFIPAFFPGFLSDSREEPDSLSQALRALESVGLGRADHPLQVNLIIDFSKGSSVQEMYEYLRDGLRPTGIRLELKAGLTPEELRRETTPYLYYLDWQLELPDPEFLIYPLFHSEAHPNRSFFHYRNQEVDNLLEIQKDSVSFRRRIQIFKQIEKLLKEDVPAIPLYFYKQRLAYQPNLRNLKAQSLGLMYLNLRDVWVDR
ncbi:MAG: ABC transporter substrate-binding protein [Acidobacteriota bacterium]|nr:ABC transporter substrate-binding protein [Acidobacteriota bacterium]MDW3229053.1 ABC transporter substrate-binding protein [Acidobacteriota bacterium]